MPPASPGNSAITDATKTATSAVLASASANAVAVKAAIWSCGRLNHSTPRAAWAFSPDSVMHSVTNSENPTTWP